MKITYDKIADALYIYFKKGKVASTKELNENLIADFDSNRKIIGLEILDVSKTLSDPKKNLDRYWQ